MKRADNFCYNNEKHGSTCKAMAKSKKQKAKEMYEFDFGYLITRDTNLYVSHD